MSVINATPIAQPAKVEGNLSARDRAIAKMQQPVPNASQISPEEMGAIQPSEPAGQSDNAEPTTPPSKAATKEEAPLSSQYAQLARKEKALRSRDLELKRREAAVAAQEAAKTQAMAPSVDLSKYIPREKLTGDTAWETLNELGITYDQLTQRALNQPSAEDQALSKLSAEVRADIKALKDAQEEARKAQVDLQDQNYKQAVGQIRNEVKDLVNSDDTYETIKATNSVDDVVELIEATFKADGVLLTPEQAAREVEEYLTEEALKIAKIKKIQDRLKPPAPKQQESQPVTKQPQQAKTLANNMTASRPLTVREKAIMAFNGQNKK